MSTFPLRKTLLHHRRVATYFSIRKSVIFD
nr:MAG TPA: hypothetical protein [Caudoviricetes sp.]